MVCRESIFGPAQHTKSKRRGDVMNTMDSRTGNPLRAVWAAGLLTLGWILMTILQVSCMGVFSFSYFAYLCLAFAVLGAAICLMMNDDIKWKLISVGFGLVSSYLVVATTTVRMLVASFRKQFMFSHVFREPILFRNFTITIVASMLCLGAVALYSHSRKKTGREQDLLCGLIGAAVYFIVRLIPSLRMFFMMMSMHEPLQLLLGNILPFFISPFVAFLVFMAVYHLCNMQQEEVKLRGIGLVWGWLALIGAAASLILVLYYALSTPAQLRMMSLALLDSSTLVTALSGVTGYFLLLRKKRIGLFFILIGTGLMLFGQFVDGITMVVYHMVFSKVFPSIIGALNPLFAWLAVKSADKAVYPSGAAPGPAANPGPVGTSPAYAPNTVSFGTVASPNPNSGSAAVNSAAKQYRESDNMGTRQENMGQAMSYWMVERRGLSVKPPFTLFTLPSADAAEKALLELPFIHKAVDSGKLICDRLMTFGYYETTLNGAPTGQYEALVAGNDLTKEEFHLAEEAFKRHGGTCKNHDEPAISGSAAKTQPAGNALSVRYKETVKGSDGISTYEVYTGPDKASAVAFLRTKPVSRRLYYIVVDTPEGSFGRDINGFYQE